MRRLSPVEAGPDDSHCAWCAAPLVVPVIDSEELYFAAEPPGCERVLTLRNEGTNVMYAALDVGGGNEAKSRFTMSPTDPYEVPAGGHQAITINFDCEKIDPAANYSIFLTIDTNAPGKSADRGAESRTAANRNAHTFPN